MQDFQSWLNGPWSANCLLKSHGLYLIYKDNSCNFYFTSRMASQVNWKELLDGRYPSHKVEVNAFLDSVNILSSTEISMDHIYQAIKSDPNVSWQPQTIVSWICVWVWQGGEEKDKKPHFKLSQSLDVSDEIFWNKIPCQLLFKQVSILYRYILLIINFSGPPKNQRTQHDACSWLL